MESMNDIDSTFMIFSRILPFSQYIDCSARGIAIVHGSNCSKEHEVIGELLVRIYPFGGSLPWFTHLRSVPADRAKHTSTLLEPQKLAVKTSQCW